MKAELKKKHITTIRHENDDKATIHLSHSFRDTAPVSPVQSKENTLVVDENDWYKDDPMETAAPDSNPDQEPW